MFTRFFLSREKRDRWTKDYMEKHNLIGMDKGAFYFLGKHIFTSTVL